MTGTADRATLRGNVRAMPPVAWILFAGTFINRFGSFVVPFLILYLTRRGYSVSQAGLAASAYGAGAVGSVFVGGYLADRLGRKRTIAVSMFASASWTLALAWARGLGLVAAVTALVGFSAELYRPASAALIADVVPSGRRVTAFALYRLAVNLGWAFGPAIGGFVANRSFVALFVADATTSALYGIVALWALPHGVRSARREERRGEAIRAVVADGRLVLFLIAVFLSAVVYMQFVATLPLQVRANGFSNATYGVLLSLNGAVIVLVELPLTSITQRLPSGKVIASGMAIVGLGFGLNAFAGTLPLMVVSVLTWTFGEMVQSAVAGAYVADRAARHVRGRYQASFVLMHSLAAIAAPIVGTTVFQHGANALWTGCALIGCLAGAIVLVAGRPGQVDVSPT